jgi:hypothetical protein
MTRAENRARVRLLLGQGNANNTAFTDTEINNMCDSCALDIATEVDLLDTQAYTASVANQKGYSLPDDMLSLTDIWLERSANDFRRMEIMTNDEWFRYNRGQVTVTGEPIVYKLEYGAHSKSAWAAGEFFPWPLASDTSYNFHVFYKRRVSELTSDSEEYQLPRAIHQAVPMYAAALLALKVKDLPLHNTLMGLYRHDIDKAQKMAQTSPQTKSQDNVRDIQDYANLDY